MPQSEKRPDSRAATLDRAFTDRSSWASAETIVREHEKERRKASGLLDSMLDRLYPRPARGPSTYGMPQPALRAYGIQLLGQGWTRDEVLVRLAIDTRGRE